MQVDSLKQLSTARILSLKHFRALLGLHGLYQHATRQVPLLSEGYCTDDNARAVQVLAVLRSVVTPLEKAALSDEIDALEDRCWRFLCEAESAPGRYWNFRAADGTWLPRNEESEDMYARIVRALVAVLVHEQSRSRAAEAETMLAGLMSECLPRLRAPRALAEILVAFAIAPVGVQRRRPVLDLIKLYLDCLQQLWNSHTAADWPWFEPVMTYANALLPHGVLGGTSYNSSSALDSILHQSTDFLVSTTVVDGVFIPIGSEGWYARGKQPSHNNQQAIEASTMLDFLIDYSAVSSNRFSVEVMAAPYLWFFGQNTGRVVMADRVLGAALDGLFDSGPNPNYGAESMLSYLWSEIRLRQAPLAVREYALAHA